SDNLNNLENINNLADNLILIEEDSSFEELDKEADELQSENDFVEYL
ncbi:1077_t:CDS:1, partial [Funneliformis geosporum]